jgi:hypothetical protein
VRGLLAGAKRREMGIARLDLRNSGDTAGPAPTDHPFMLSPMSSPL